VVHEERPLAPKQSPVSSPKIGGDDKGRVVFVERDGLKLVML